MSQRRGRSRYMAERLCSRFDGLMAGPLGCVRFAKRSDALAFAPCESVIFCRSIKLLEMPSQARLRKRKNRSSASVFDCVQGCERFGVDRAAMRAFGLVLDKRNSQ